MNDQKDPQLNREENLRAENNLLKLKLGLEHGIQMEDGNGLGPELENQWLKHVHAFEQQYKNARPIRLYDYLDRPEFKKWDALDPEQTAQELKRLLAVMRRKNVELDCICTYDDALIYRFITEELFAHEMDDMRIPGMICHFTYEEFHPNHDYDLRQQVTDFLNRIFERQWDKEFDEFALALKVKFSGKCHDRANISAIITSFQEAHGALQIAKLDITEVVIDTEVTMADVAARLSVSGKRQGEAVLYEGGCSFHFVREDGYWYMDAFEVPGMGEGS